MGWLRYAWTVAVNCFYLFVIVWVFDKLDGHRELSITIAVLGLIYVTIRNIGMGLAAGIFESLSRTQRQLLQVQQFVRDPNYDTNQKRLDEEEELKKTTVVKMYINSFFLWLIGLVCLLVLFATLSNLPSRF
jgi:hypothetical protein